MGRRQPPRIPESVLEDAVRPVLERLAELAAEAPPVYRELLEDMAERLLDPDVKMNHLWKGRRLHPAAHTGMLARVLGKRPTSFLCDLRMEVAIRLLGDERISGVSGMAIAYEAGFKNYEALNDAVKTRFGMTPKAYRKACRHAGPPQALTDEPHEADDGEPRDTVPGFSEAVDALESFRNSLARIDRLTVCGQLDRAEIEFDRAVERVDELGRPEALAAQLCARRGFLEHRRAEFLVRELEVDEAWSALEKARAAYAAAGELPPVVSRVRRHVQLHDDARATLIRDLCRSCARELLSNTGTTLRAHLSRALEPVPQDLEWFEVCCDECYRVVWEAIDTARLGLVDDAWKACWLVAHADPVEEVPPSLARYVGALHLSESLTHREQQPRLELCRLAEETARELGDPVREAYARCFVGNALRAVGRLEEARAKLQKARELCQGNPWAEAFQAMMEGYLAAQEKDRKVALTQLAKARSLYDRIDPHLSALPLMDEGEYFFIEREYEAAMHAFEQASATLDQRRAPLLALGMVPLNTASALVAQGRATDARTALARCEFDRSTHLGVRATELFLFGAIALEEGCLEGSLQFFREAEALFESLHRLRAQALVFSYSVEAYARLGNRDQALENSAAALRLFEALGCNHDTTEAFAQLREQLEATWLDAAAVALTVRRLAQLQGGWLPEPGGLGEPTL